jgi:hypothetical protein
MSRTSTAHLAVAADYADALMTARRAKNLLFLALLLLILGQLAVFLLVRYNVLKLDSRVTVNAGVTPPAAAPATPSTPTTAPSDLTESGLTTQPTGEANPVTPGSPAAPTAPRTSTATAGEILQYVIPGVNFLGVVFSIVLAIVLLLLTTIMLVGRLVGVSHVTGGFVWSVVLALLLFPWQAFLIHTEHYGITGTQASTSAHPAWDDVAPQPAFKVPGVLYTYPELRQDYDFPNKPIVNGIIKWGRFAGFPVLALLILLLVQGKSSRGLKQALGETEIHVEVSNRGNEPLV